MNNKKKKIAIIEDKKPFWFKSSFTADECGWIYCTRDYRWYNTATIKLKEHENMAALISNASDKILDCITLFKRK